MAWITKNSATVEVPKRDEPYLNDAIKKKINDEILPKYEASMGALLPVLHEVQHHIGYLPYQALVEVSAFLDVPAQIVLDTASFYDEFFLQPVGKYHIGVCQSIACEACGHQEIINHLRAKLGVEPGETTPDGMFMLRAMECLGSCDTAPCGLFNEDRRDNLTVEEVDQFIDAVRASNAQAGEKSVNGSAAAPPSEADSADESADGRDGDS